MEYPLISEYKEAILSAEDNFNELASLRPVLDRHGDPVMSSGNFAVVFKMRNENDGELYAVKCFIKDQEGRDESYRKIADELETVSSSYILPLRYLENELFVDSAQCDRQEFPVVVMKWVEGETLDAYLNRNLYDKYELEMLSYRFNRMAAWLLAQPFAHGDLKPDNILVRNDGSLVLVDYDGMFLPSMKGEKAREIGSPDYRHPARTDSDFDEHIDDFSIAVIALSLMAIAINPKLKTSSSDSLLINEQDYKSPSDSTSLKDIQCLTYKPTLSKLLGIFYIALAINSLDSVSFRLFLTDRPKTNTHKQHKVRERIDTSCSDKDIEEGVMDELGVIYSRDGKRLLKCNSYPKEYCIKPDTQIICDKAFDNIYTLQSISIPASVIAIGDCAFAAACGLQSMIIPKSVISIGNHAFSVCTSLQSVIIPKSVTLLGDAVFNLCPNLTLTLSYESSFKLINGLLIDNSGRLICCINHSKCISIPECVTTIGERAFYKCLKLQSIIIPDSVTAIGDYAFSLCSSLQSVEMSQSLNSIGNEAFSDCSSLKFVSIPDFVTTIGYRAFSECLSLQTVSIPELVTVLQEGTFRGCSSLMSVSLPKSMNTIGEGAFYECSSLKSVSIPDSVISIGNCAFLECESLQSISIPKSMNTIGEAAFYRCSSIESISIPDSVTSIGDSAFSGCTSLKTVSISKSVTRIGYGTFKRCFLLQSVIIPNSVTTIGNEAFSYCESLKGVTIPDSVSIIGKDAFYSCKSLQNVSFPNSLTLIGKGAFWGCDSLPSAALPDKEIIIEDNAFPTDCLVFAW